MTEKHYTNEEYEAMEIMDQVDYEMEKEEQKKNEFVNCKSILVNKPLNLNLADQVDYLKKKIKNLEEKLSKKEELIEEYFQENKMLKKSKESLHETCERWSNDFTRLQKENEKLAEKNKDLKEILKSYKNTIDHPSYNKTDLDKNIKGLLSNLELPIDSKDPIQTIEKYIGKLIQENKNLSNNLNCCDNELEERNNQILKQYNRLEQLSIKVSQLRKTGLDLCESATRILNCYNYDEFYRLSISISEFMKIVSDSINVNDVEEEEE